MDCLEAHDDDPEVGCIVLTGNERAFAAGADIAEMEKMEYIDVFQGSFFFFLKKRKYYWKEKKFEGSSLTMKTFSILFYRQVVCSFETSSIFEETCDRCC